MPNLLQEFTALLASDERFATGGTLLKNRIIERALAMDGALLKLLLQSPALKRHFFVEVDGIPVFDKIRFQRFVSNKQFLPDSYTAYRNTIGLAAGDDYLADNRAVVLAWPYKDCVLEGGQSREEDRRREVFWNETLAREEIDRLFAPKVLTGFRRHSRAGAAPADALKPDDNLIIKGNNLLALHTLKARYREKIDLIYIDPPFNTENDGFQYNDRFNRSTWLVFMRNRLEAARELLRPSGTIYVHVDHNEGHYLKVLMDEIFGEEYFRNEIVWHYSGWNKKLNASFEKRHDTIFIYGKSDAPYFASWFEQWPSKEAYVKKRKQKLLLDEDGREYVLSDAGGGKRVKMFIEDVLMSGVAVDDVWQMDKLNNSARESVGFTTQKTEALLERIITASCPPGGIVLDFHLGSGTTAAAAHKLGRRYIGIEQMDYLDTLTVPRLEKVIAGDQEGISKSCGWQGGGEFVYCELARANQRFADAILATSGADELAAVWKAMRDKAFLSYRIDLAAADGMGQEFAALDLPQQKRLLLEMLDKNLLYVPLSEIDDADFAISDTDKALNRQFFTAPGTQM